jgi:hypothetical protein
MYRWMRNAHLVLGLLAVPMLLMYGISAIGMDHHGWFTGKPRVSERAAQLNPAPDRGDARALARALMQQCGLRGVLKSVEPRTDGFRLEIGRVGTSYAIDYNQDTREATIQTTTLTLMGMLNRLHHIGTVRSPSLAVNVLGALVLVVSVCLILLALSGIYLWFQFHRERVIGTVLLALSLAYGLTFIVLIHVA